MGAETSSLQMSGVTIGESVPLKSPHPSPASSKGSSLSSSSSTTSPPWTLHRGEDANGKPVSLFVYPKPEENSGKKSSGGLDGLPAAFKHAKVLRHPSLVKFQGIFTASDGRLVLVTEPVAPLLTIIESMTVEEITAGIYSILSSLVFLHNRVGVCHNNVALSSVFVSSDNGAWKLGALDHLKTHGEATWDWLRSSRPRRDASAITPEEKQKGPVGGGVEAVAAQARDAYAFGQFTLALLNYVEEENEGDEPKGIDEFKVLISAQFLNADPKKRPRLSSFLNHVFFKNNNYCDIINFLDTLPLKTSDEKEAFFMSLSGRLSCLSTSLVAFRLVRPLLRRFVLVEPSARLHFVPHLLTPKGQDGDTTPSSQLSRESSPSTSPQHSSSSSASLGILTDDLFAETVIPHLCNIVLVRDHDIFLTILRLLPQYLHLIPKDKLEETFLPQMLLGLQDASDDIVAASLGGLSSLVPILGGDAVIGRGNDPKQKPRTKIFAYGAPRGFRDATSPSKPKTSPVKGPGTLLSLSNRIVDKLDSKKTDTTSINVTMGRGKTTAAAAATAPLEAATTDAEEERRRKANEEKGRKREEKSLERKKKIEQKKLEKSAKKESSPVIKRVDSKIFDDRSMNDDAEEDLDPPNFKSTSDSCRENSVSSVSSVQSLARQDGSHTALSPSEPPQQQQQLQPPPPKPRISSETGEMPHRPLAHVTPYMKRDASFAMAPIAPTPASISAAIVAPLPPPNALPSNTPDRGDWPDWSNDDTDDDVDARHIENVSSSATILTPLASVTEPRSVGEETHRAKEQDWSDEDWGEDDDWNGDESLGFASASKPTASASASASAASTAATGELDDGQVVSPSNQKSTKSPLKAGSSTSSPSTNSIKVLKLVGSSSKQSQASSSAKGTTSAAVSSAASTAVRATTTTASAPAIAAVTAVASVNKDLGSEFDVKAIRVRKKEEPPPPEEVDFFADMTPDFGANTSDKKKKGSKNSDSSFFKSTLAAVTVIPQSSTPIESKFVVLTSVDGAAVAEDDVDGWDDADDITDDWADF